MLGRSAGLLLLLVGAQAVAGDIVVKIDGVQAEGEVALALVFADQQAWPATVLRQVHSREPTVRLRNLPPGRYALQLYQDSNGNGQLDVSPRGVPLEPVGFSNNPALLTGKPAPLKCGFEHGAGDTEVQITLQSPKAKR
ncbi:uncharacterized protein (DUF2141 family) [Pseudomonas sp. TE3786]